MSGPYRVAEVARVDVPHHGLVRANGSRCNCAPPGFWFCWWNSVQVGDRWSCRHGGGWLRVKDYAKILWGSWAGEVKP